MKGTPARWAGVPFSGRAWPALIRSIPAGPDLIPKISVHTPYSRPLRRDS